MGCRGFWGEKNTWMGTESKGEMTRDEGEKEMEGVGGRTARVRG